MLPPISLRGSSWRDLFRTHKSRKKSFCVQWHIPAIRFEPGTALVGSTNTSSVLENRQYWTTTRDFKKNHYWEDREKNLKTCWWDSNPQALFLLNRSELSLFHLFLSQHTVRDETPWGTWFRKLHWWMKVGKRWRWKKKKSSNRRD